MMDEAEPTLLTERVIKIVETQPGITSGEIYKLIPEIKSTSIAACLCHLMKREHLDRTGVPRAYRYYLGGDGPASDSTTDEPAAQAAETGPVRTICAPEMRRQAAAAMPRVMPPIVGGHRADELSITADGAVSIPTPAGVVTLDPEQTRAVGRFLMFTIGVWEPERTPCS